MSVAFDYPGEPWKLSSPISYLEASASQVTRRQYFQASEIDNQNCFSIAAKSVESAAEPAQRNCKLQKYNLLCLLVRVALLMQVSQLLVS